MTSEEHIKTLDDYTKTIVAEKKKTLSFLKLARNARKEINKLTNQEIIFKRTGKNKAQLEICQKNAEEAMFLIQAAAWQKMCSNTDEN